VPTPFVCASPYLANFATHVPDYVRSVDGLAVPVDLCSGADGPYVRRSRLRLVRGLASHPGAITSVVAWTRRRHEALEPGVEDALVASKLDALAAEYGHLLSSQLESQRAWYDARQAKAVAAAEAGCAPLQLRERCQIETVAASG